jgi:GTP-binding protein
VIPFSAETKQGREEIWNLIESLVEIPEELVLAEAAKQEAKAQAQERTKKAEESGRKPRWKSTDRPVAKKTLKKRQEKKKKK